MTHLKAALCALMVGMAATQAEAAPGDAPLKAVMDDEWAWFLKTNPVYATMLGHPTDDRSLGASAWRRRTGRRRRGKASSPGSTRSPTAA